MSFSYPQRRWRFDLCLRQAAAGPAVAACRHRPGLW